MEVLKKNYKEAVNAYIKEFEQKYEIEFDFWIGDLIGGVCCFGDYSFNFSDIKYVVDNSIPFEYLSDWYWFIVEYEKCYYDLNSYCKLRRDEEKKEQFNLHSFEKNLIYMRVELKQML